MDNFRLFPVEAAAGAVQVDRIYFALLGLATIIVLLVTALIVVFSIRYRRSAEASRHRLPKWLSREIEIGWTVATLFVFLFIFWWAGAQNLAALTPPDNPFRIHVVAKQWMWKAEHADGIREIDALHVPVGRKVLIDLNSQDVIHSFYVPAFRIKRDVVPGRTERLWFTPTVPGEYKLLCAEFCGTQHSHMTGRIVAMKPEDYTRWAATTPKADDLVAGGARLFRAYGCSGCHEGGPVRAPDLHGVFGSPVPLSDGRVVSADARYIRDSILFPMQDVAAGYKPVMPSFRKRVSDDELAQIVAYVKSLADEAPHD